MLERLQKLLTVKSIVTILLTIVVAILTLKGQFNIEDIYLMITLKLILKILSFAPVTLAELLKIFALRNHPTG